MPRSYLITHSECEMCIIKLGTNLFLNCTHSSLVGSERLIKSVVEHFYDPPINCIFSARLTPKILSVILIVLVTLILYTMGFLAVLVTEVLVCYTLILFSNVVQNSICVPSSLKRHPQWTTKNGRYLVQSCSTEWFISIWKVHSFQWGV